MRSFGMENAFNDNFLNYLMTRRVAIIEANNFVETRKQQYCALRPTLRWHIVDANLGQFPVALGFRKGLSKTITSSINKMLAIFLLLIIQHLIIFNSLVKIFTLGSSKNYSQFRKQHTSEILPLRN